MMVMVTFLREKNGLSVPVNPHSNENREENRSLNPRP